tara:strand:- start:237 stop:1100 length:864 start_codon:yes stop_codon:yes gene_type:complete
MRKLIQVINAQPTQDGDGVSIYRIAGRQHHSILNPYLMIDEINSDDVADYIGGFPEHPHRGFETITYMKAGRMRHRDHMGNEGVISAGDVQWMTAGAGVLHSEMPEQDQGLMHGFQIWLNLPARDKMIPAAYQEILKVDITQQALSDGGLVRIIAGKVTINQQLLQGPLPERATQPILLDVQMTANEVVELAFETDNPAWVYVYNGETDLISTRQLGIYNGSGVLQLSAGAMGTELLVLSGRPINEPIVQYGPYVMNTQQQIQSALQDFQDPQFLSQLASNNGVISH